MKKLLSMVMLGSVVALTGMAKSADLISVSKAADPMNIAGTYECKGHDAHDGDYSGRFVLVRDENASDTQQGIGAYKSVPAFSKEKNEIHGYNEFMIVQGHYGAMYFEHEHNKKDYGVKLFTVTQAKNSEGKMVTTLSGPYYQPVYERHVKGRSGYGNATCTQVN